MRRSAGIGRLFSGLLAAACVSTWLCGAALAAEAEQPPATGLFAPTLVDAAPPAELVRTRHEAEFGGEAVAYEVVTGEYVLLDHSGEPAATMFSTSYIRIDETGPQRPVLFLFNGGPGASSSPLHLGVGPVRRPPDDPDRGLETFSSSPLDATDMVFVDPVGTGYSRLFREGAGLAYWGIEQDADAVLLFIADWLRREGREAAPVFIMGESYGGIRAITLLARAEDVRFAGALLLSPAIDMTAGTPVVGNNLPYVFRLPSMAATSVYHDVIQGAGSPMAVFEDTAAFAQSDYAAALYRGNALPEDEKRALAAELAARTGLPAAYWLEQNLRVTAHEFSDRLLEDAGMRVGRLDTRARGPLAQYRDNRPPQDDPGFSGGRGGSVPTSEMLDAYFETELDTHIDRPYRTLNLDANTHWDFGHKSGRPMYFSAAPDLEKAMQEHPELRVWVGGGIYDLATPIMAARYILGQLDVDPSRLVFRGYEGGHTVFEHEPSRAALAVDMRRFITETARAQTAAAAPTE